MADTDARDAHKVEVAFHPPETQVAAYERPQTLKADDTFLLADPFGDCGARAGSAEGLFHMDTRYLSRLVFKVNGVRPLLLSSKVSADNGTFRADLTNPDLQADNRVVLARDTIHLIRSNRLEPGSLQTRFELRSFSSEPIAIELAVEYQSDFADIFEVRGARRSRRGLALSDHVDNRCVAISYEGLDRVVRTCSISFSRPADDVTAGRALHRIVLRPHEQTDLSVTVACQTMPHAGDVHARQACHHSTPNIATSKELFNHWIDRSQADLNMLMTRTSHGPYPYAGIPWFSAPFGRDGIIAALQLLWLEPRLARGVLGFLTATQATGFDDAADAEPGKVLHEARQGEMATLGEVPFRRYYGSVDATPLFVVLAVACWERTGDTDFMRSLWPSIRAALAWLRDHGDVDGDGFVEYARRTGDGLINQGWKDSADSVFHADGSLAEAPIALVEVQAYAFTAWSGAARLAAALGHADEQLEYAAAAEALRQRFEQAFWCEELDTYAIALDRAKRPCRVASSNAGHALFAGIASEERARRVAARLLKADSFSGWGIRTIAEGSARYNPMAYHNGSVWPHDNGLIAMGFARYGMYQPLLELTEAMFATSQCMELNRLPELFCGFARRTGEMPTCYPIACAPQAWSTTTVFALLGALLGISFDAAAQRVHVNRPQLPDYLDEVRITGLSVGDGRMDLLLRRHLRDVAVNVVGKEGNGELVLTSG